MIVQLLAYLLALVAAAVVAPLIGLVFFLLVWPFIRPFSPLRRSSILLNFVTSVASMGTAMLLFIWLLRRIDANPTFLMFLLPWIAVQANGFRRLDAAKKKQFLSGLGQFLAKQDPNIEFEGITWGEYGYMLGDAVGIWAPVVFSDEHMSFW